MTKEEVLRGEGREGSMLQNVQKEVSSTSSTGQLKGSVREGGGTVAVRQREEAAAADAGGIAVSPAPYSAPAPYSIEEGAAVGLRRGVRNDQRIEAHRRRLEVKLLNLPCLALQQQPPALVAFILKLRALVFHLRKKKEKELE